MSSRFRMTRCIPLIVTLCASVPSPAQVSVSVLSPPFIDCPTARFTVRVVDSSGRAVAGLNSSSFSLTENGSPRTVSVREITGGQDTSVVILLDQSGSIGNSIGEVRRAAQRLVQLLPDGTAIQVIGFNDRIFTYTSGFTADRAAVVRLLDGVTTASGNTKLYDSIIVAANALSARPGRRAIVVLSDGQDTDSSASLEGAIAAALDAVAPIFTMGHGDEYNNPTFRQVLARLAGETGGFTYGSPQASNLSSFAELIAPQVSSSYEITYTASSPADRIPQSAVRLAVRTPGGNQEVEFRAPSCSAAITISASPNPIPVAQGQTTGDTTITWNASPPLGSADRVHLRAGSYNGPVLGNIARQPNSFLNLSGVPDNTRIYLQFISPDGSSNQRFQTLGSVLIRLKPPDQPPPGATLSVSPVTNCSSPVARITWEAPGAGEVQVRTGGASGTAVTGWLPDSGSTETGPWVTNGMVFVLVDRSGRELARATAVVNCTGPATLTVSTVTNCSSPAARITWDAPGAGEVQVRVGGTGGTAVTGWSPNNGSTVTGPWVTNGMIFVLVDRSGRELARATAVLNCDSGPASLTVSTVTNCSSPVARIAWDVSGAGEVQVRVGGTGGAALTGWVPGKGSTDTGPWVTDGMIFVLVDRTGRELARATAVVNCTGPATLTVSTVTNCSSPVARITWDAPAAGEVQVRVGGPAGTPLTGWVPSKGSTDTGPWVTNGMIFVLVNRSGRELARATAVANCTGPVTLIVSTVTNCSSPVARITWDAPGAGEVQVRVGGTGGAALTGWSPSKGSADTGPWVTNGMIFVLVNRSGRELARAAAVVDCGPATLTVSPVGTCAPLVARVTWNAPGAGEVQVLVLDSGPGMQLTDWSPNSGSQLTGPWVENGTVFVLIDRFRRELARATAVVAPCGLAVLAFTAPAVIRAGEEVDFSYDTQGAVRVEIRDRAGQVLFRSSEPRGTAPILVTASSSFTLVAFDGAGRSVTRELAVQTVGNAVCPAFAPPAFDGRVLPLAFYNDGPDVGSNAAVPVYLYHPAVPLRSFSTTEVPAGSNVYLTEDGFGVGSDWGIRVRDTGCVVPVGQWSTYLAGKYWQTIGNAVTGIRRP